MITASVRSSFAGQRRLAGKVASMARSGPVAEAIRRRVPAMFFSFLQRRYRLFAAGGGDWKKLAESTAERKGSEDILIDSGFSYRSLRMDSPSALVVVVVTSNGFNVRAGLSTTAGTHPDARMPVGKLLLIHAKGNQNLPKRRVVVPPDSGTQAVMKAVVVEAARRLLR